MSKNNSCLLIINAGSSSLKFGLYTADAGLRLLVSGKFDRIRLPEGRLTLQDLATGRREDRSVRLPDHSACLPILAELIEKHLGSASLKGIGHRVVHGGPRFRDPALVTDDLLAALHEYELFAPQHVPVQLEIIEAFRRQWPALHQVACFDTAFHADLPEVARILPIPRRYYDRGVRRYGFHGLSYAYLMQELERIAGPDAAAGRIILAHLGHGASMAAVSGGRSIDTTMSFTPAAGLVMSTRPGDLDPGLATYLRSVDGLDEQAFDRMINKESGLLGISETSSDIRDLLSKETSDRRAGEALAVFCYQCRKWIGALAAALGGLDTLVFSGGIGENAAVIRARICRGLEFLGVALELPRNRDNDPVISPDTGKVTVRVIPTDEEMLIARQTCGLLRL